MNKQKLLETINHWQKGSEYRKIRNAILSIPEPERDDELLGALVMAHNNLFHFDASMALLEQLRPRQENTSQWQFDFAFALYYMDKNEEAKLAFERCLQLQPSQDCREECLAFLEAIEQSRLEEQMEDRQADSLVQGIKQVMMDHVEPHLARLRDKQLPLDELAAYNHMAIYLRWSIEKGLMSDQFVRRLPDLTEGVTRGKRRLDLRKQLRDRIELNHALIHPYFNEKGVAFALYYYTAAAANDTSTIYAADVDEYARNFFGPQRYHAEEYKGAAYLFVPYDERYYQGMKQILDRRFEHWTDVYARMDQSAAPAPLAKTMMKYLDCPCRFFPPTVDDDGIVTAYRKAARRGRKEGFVPVLVAVEDTLWECLLMNSDENGAENEGDGFDPKAVAAYRKSMLETPLPSWEEVAARLLKTGREVGGYMAALEEMEDGRAGKRFLGYWDYASRATLPLILAEIPVKHPWEVFAYLPFGGWNECPDTPELMAVSKYWFALHGAAPAVMTHDVLEYYLRKPVKKLLAMQLALEQYAWCPDIIDQGGEDATVGRLAGSLAKSTCWYFWWD